MKCQCIFRSYPFAWGRPEELSKLKDFPQFIAKQIKDIKEFSSNEGNSFHTVTYYRSLAALTHEQRIRKDIEEKSIFSFCPYCGRDLLPFYLKNAPKSEAA